METTSAAPEAQPVPAGAAAARHPLDAAKVWTDLLSFWNGRQTAGAEVLTATAVQTYRAVLEVNQTATTAIHDAIQRQQKLVFATTQAALSAFEDAVASGLQQHSGVRRVQTGAAAQR